ncbi:LuxR C-terminal-related transcriptional regulator [Sphingomonas sp. Root1294]|uniref:LuxR C-terminal-related transcriptional regulator n=1 Tax=Sphingomonas sp. Root1294 TaxID=1736447 RepID=UPI00138F4176|nr:LuxR C-terminal-related transcriptional regulator [Sphingomonas sp. Root1294]
MLPDGPERLPRSPDDTATLLSAWLAARDRAITLLIDDVDRLAPDALALLTRIVSELRPGTQIICAARATLLDTWHDLAASGAIGIVNRQALGFRRPEVMASLIPATSEAGASQHIAMLATLTDNVPLFVRFARETLEEGASDPVGALVARVAAWLRSEVSAAFDPKTVDLLSTVSILTEPEVETGLVAALTSRTDAQALLAALARATPLAWLRTNGQCRIHPLVPILFPQPSDTAREEGYRRAGLWLAEHRPVAAIGDLIRVRDYDRACALIEAELMDAVTTGRVATALDWIESIPDEVLQARSGLRIAICWALAIGGRADEMRRWLDIDPPTASGPLKAVIEGLVACGADDPDLAVAKAAEAADVIEAQPAFEAVRQNILRWVNQQRGEGPTRVAPGLAQGDARRSPRQFYSFVLAAFRDAETALDKGQALEAVEMLVPVERRARQELGPRAAATAILSSVLAAAHRQAGDNPSAAAALGTNLVSGASWAIPSALWLAFATRARLARDMGDVAEAFALIEQIEQIAVARRFYRIRAMALTEGIRLGITCELPDTVRPRVSRLRALLDEADGFGPIRARLVRLYGHLGLAGALLADADWPAAEASLQTGLAIARQLGRTYVEADLLLLRARVPGSTAADPAALVGPRDWETLQRDLDAGVALAQRRPTPAATGAKAVLLTSKEREVLELLAAGVPNKQIAQALLISVETVKWHLKNVFNKLDVHDRGNVVLRARELALID